MLMFEMWPAQSWSRAAARPRAPLPAREPLTHPHPSNAYVEMCAGAELELALLPDLAPHYPHVSHSHIRTQAMLMFEMCAGAELELALLPDLAPHYPHVVEIIELIFGPRTPTLHELLLCELFRKIDLREMKGSCLPNFNQRLSRSCLSLLGEVARRQGGGGGAGSGAGAGGARPRLARSGHASPAGPATPPGTQVRLIASRHFTTDQDYTEDWQW
ncbi:hypothetical protein ACJJTC_012562 [Scirpophaga incertulas]